MNQLKCLQQKEEGMRVVCFCCINKEHLKPTPVQQSCISNIP